MLLSRVARAVTPVPLYPMSSGVRAPAVYAAVGDDEVLVLVCGSSCKWAEHAADALYRSIRAMSTKPIVELVESGPEYDDTDGPWHVLLSVTEP